MTPRFEVVEIDGWHTVWDRERDCLIDHQVNWAEAAAEHVAAALNAHPYQAEQWKWTES